MDNQFSHENKMFRAAIHAIEKSVNIPTSNLSIACEIFRNMVDDGASPEEAMSKAFEYMDIVSTHLRYTEFIESTKNPTI